MGHSLRGGSGVGVIDLGHWGMDRGGLIIILSCYFIGQYIIYTGCCLVHIVYDAVI